MRFDYVLVGGGLQNALLALALRARRPGARIALVERDSRLGGNHTWSFHEGDVAEALGVAGAARRAPLARLRRGVPGEAPAARDGYSASPSPRLDAVVRGALASGAGLGALLGSRRWTSIERSRACLRDGRVMEGRRWSSTPAAPRAPTRPRGRATRSSSGSSSGFASAGRPDPARRSWTPPSPSSTVSASCTPCPWRPIGMLVEDTYYSDRRPRSRGPARAGPRLRRGASGCRWGRWCARRRASFPSPGPREERCPLPQDGPLRAGYAGGFFHPTTGYSLPVAVRLASCLASVPPEEARPPWSARLRATRGQARFCRLLNWLLFCAYPPDQRFHVLERFYRLPEATIRRFYALELTMADRARLLLGRPPAGLSLRAAFSRWQAA